MVTNKHHAAKGIEEEMKDLQLRLDDIKARIKAVKSRSNVRKRLAEYCKKNGISRSDLMSAVNDLPKMRITRKDREDRIAHDKANRNQFSGDTNIGQRIRGARQAKGWTLKQLGKAVGRDPSAVRCWEIGKHNVPPDVQPKVIKALDLTEAMFQ